MDWFGSDEREAAPVKDPEIARLKAEDKKRIEVASDAKKEEEFARSKRMRGSKSLMSGGYRGYDDEKNKLGTKV